jgi:hypothetical protein
MKPVRIVLLVAAVLAVAFIVGFFYIVNDDESAMVAGGALFFGRLSDGKVDEAYDTAGEPLRLSMDRQEIHFLADDLKRFGRFRKIVDVTHLETGKAGGWLQATLLYKEQSVKAKLSFARIGRTWKIIGVELDFPTGAFPPPDEQALLAAARQFHQELAADDRNAIYVSIHPAARRRIPPEKLDADITRLQSSCGKMTIGEPEPQAGAAEGTAVVGSKVMCEKSGHASLRTSWLWLRTRWMLGDIDWQQST